MGCAYHGKSTTLVAMPMPFYQLANFDPGTGRISSRPLPQTALHIRKPQQPSRLMLSAIRGFPYPEQSIFDDIIRP